MDAGLAAAIWLVVASLAVQGARRRGQGWGLACLSGLFFPVTWTIWYLVDDHAAGGRTSRRQRRAAQ